MPARNTNELKSDKWSFLRGSRSLFVFSLATHGLMYVWFYFYSLEWHWWRAPLLVTLFIPAFLWIPAILVAGLMYIGYAATRSRVGGGE